MAFPVIKGSLQIYHKISDAIVYLVVLRLV